jgi:hypothetical protein
MERDDKNPHGKTRDIFSFFPWLFHFHWADQQQVQ